MYSMSNRKISDIDRHKKVKDNKVFFLLCQVSTALSQDILSGDIIHPVPVSGIGMYNIASS